MKTIATAAVFSMLAVPTWADDPASARTNDSANSERPIVLSEAEMDGVTAGGEAVEFFGRPLLVIAEDVEGEGRQYTLMSNTIKY